MRNTSYASWGRFVAGSICLCTHATIAWSQAMGMLPSTPESAAAPEGLVEIIVTAQRRSENLQSVPISVTAITAEGIAKANITNTNALEQVTPGLTNSISLRSALPYIRGVGSSDSTVGSENPVALYVDGVYIDNSQAAAFNLNNIERIEVLKGPQGTLFGRNATGGLISLTTKTPSQTFSGEAEVGYGNFDSVRSSLYVTGPINHSLAADLAVTYSREADGWGRNINSGRDIDTDQLSAFRTKWFLDLSDTRFIFTGDYSREKTDIGVERNLGAGAVGPADTVFRGSFYDSQSDINPIGLLRDSGISIRAEHDFLDAKFTSLSSYRDTFFTTGLDQDETPLAIFDGFITDEIHDITQEIQVASVQGGAVDWIGGAFFLHRNAFQNPSELTGSAFAGPPFFGSGAYNDGVITNTGAPFAQATWHVTSSTDLTGGLRYTIEHQRFVGDESNAKGVPFLTVDTDVTYRKPTFRAAVEQHITGDVMLYGSFNRGFKGGAYNVNALQAPPARPETLDAFEIGIKSDWLEHRLRANFAVFDYDYRDIQLLVAPPPSSGEISTTINAARARIVGLEGSIDAAPLQGLTLSTGWSIMPTAKYESFPNAPLLYPKMGGGYSLDSFNDSGGRMIRAPKFTGTVAVDYLAPSRAGDLDFSSNLYHTSAIIWNPDARYTQKAYTLVNAQLSLKVIHSQVRVSLWGANLFNRQYQTGFSETALGDVYVPGAPRTYGVKFNYAF